MAPMAWPNCATVTPWEGSWRISAVQVSSSSAASSRRSGTISRQPSCSSRKQAGYFTNRPNRYHTSVRGRIRKRISRLIWPTFRPIWRNTD